MLVSDGSRGAQCLSVTAVEEHNATANRRGGKETTLRCSRSISCRSRSTSSADRGSSGRPAPASPRTYSLNAASRASHDSTPPGSPTETSPVSIRAR